MNPRLEEEVFEMWETPFDVSLLDAPDGVSINCPTEELEREVAAMFDSLGLRYPGGNELSAQTPWEEYKEEFCYCVVDGKVRRGDKITVEESSWSKSTKCTFYGIETPDFDAATDEELLAFLGA